jgi:hypothetical protein
MPTFQKLLCCGVFVSLSGWRLFFAHNAVFFSLETLGPVISVLRFSGSSVRLSRART